MSGFKNWYSCKSVERETSGDKNLEVSLYKMDGKALFTKELEDALLTSQVDMVVHSLKDLPTSLPEGLIVAAVSARENPQDAVIVHPKHGKAKLNDLPQGAIIGTSSLRRVAQLSRNFKHLKFESIRGNLNTRLRKLDDDNKFDAIVLAAAGVIRMGWQNRITQRLDESQCMYAVGQGALAVQCRASDESTRSLLAPICDADATVCVVAERALMNALEGGCSVPIAVNTQLLDGELKIKGGVWSVDGQKELISSLKELIDQPFESSDISDTEKNNGNKNNDILQPPSKKARTEINEECFCGVVATSISESSRLRISHELGRQLAKELLDLGARAVLDEARAIVKPLSAPVKNDAEKIEAPNDILKFSV